LNSGREGRCSIFLAYFSGELSCCFLFSCDESLMGRNSCCACKFSLPVDKVIKYYHVDGRKKTFGPHR